MWPTLFYLINEIKKKHNVHPPPNGQCRTSSWHSLEECILKTGELGTWKYQSDTTTPRRSQSPCTYEVRTNKSKISLPSKTTWVSFCIDTIIIIDQCSKPSQKTTTVQVLIDSHFRRFVQRRYRPTTTRTATATATVIVSRQSPPFSIPTPSSIRNKERERESDIN